MSVINKFLALTFGVSTPDSKIIECRESIKELESERDTLKQQNDELLAQVEVLRLDNEAIEGCLAWLSEHEQTIDVGECHIESTAGLLARHLNAMRAATPAKFLLEVMAEAGRDGYKQGVNDLRHAQSFGSRFNSDDGADRYANKIREGKS